MLEELLAHLASARDDDAVRVLVLSSTDHMGLSAGADVREELDDDGAIRRMQLFADLYDALTGFPKPTIAACHGACVGGGAEIAVACDLRVGGSNLRLRFPGARARRPGRPGAPGHPLRPLGRQVPAADLEGGRRRRGAALGPRPQGRAGAGDRGGGAPARRPGRRAPARGGRAAQADAPRVGRRRGPLAGRGRGPGRVAALRAPGCRTSPANQLRRSLRGRLLQSPARHRARRRALRQPRRPRSAAGEAVDVRASGSIAAVPARGAAEAEDGARRPPGARRRRRRPRRPRPRAEARRLPAPRRVRYYPSRGTGYESHLAPPPHLVGLRIAALDALTGDGDERAAGRRRQRRRARRGGPRRLAAPGRLRASPRRGDRPRRRRRAARRGRLRARRAGRGPRPVRGPRRHPRRLRRDRGPGRADRAVRRRDRVDPLLLDLHPALARRGRADRARPGRRDRRPSTASWPRSRSPTTEEDEAERLAELLPLDRFRAFLDLIDERHGGRDRRRRGDRPRARRPLGRRDARRCTTTTRATSTSRSPSRSRDRAAADGPLSVRPDDREHAFRAPVPASAARSLAEAERELEKQLRSGYVTVVAFERRGEAERARYDLDRLDADAPRVDAPGADDAGASCFAEAPLADGFVSPDLRLAVIPYRRLVHRRRAAAPAPAARPRWRRSATSRVGDHVVHEDHGVARFAGFETKTVAGITRDYLELEYRGEDRVFAPGRAAREDHPLRRRRRRGAAALGARRQALGRR